MRIRNKSLAGSREVFPLKSARNFAPTENTPSFALMRNPIMKSKGRWVDPLRQRPSFLFACWGVQRQAGTPQGRAAAAWQPIQLTERSTHTDLHELNF